MTMHLTIKMNRSAGLCISEAQSDIKLAGIFGDSVELPPVHMGIDGAMMSTYPDVSMMSIQGHHVSDSNTTRQLCQCQASHAA